MPSRFVDVTDRELTQFLEKNIKGFMNNYYSLVHCFGKFSSHYLPSFSCSR